MTACGCFAAPSFPSIRQGRPWPVWFYGRVISPGERIQNFRKSDSVGQPAERCFCLLDLLRGQAALMGMESGGLPEIGHFQLVNKTLGERMGFEPLADAFALCGVAVNLKNRAALAIGFADEIVTLAHRFTWFHTVKPFCKR